MDDVLLFLAVAVAALASAAGGAGALGALTGWTRAAAWFFASLLLAPVWIGIGLWLGSTLSNGDCDDICATPAWYGFLFGAITAAGQLVIAVLAGLLWLSGHRDSRARAVQPM